MEFAPPYAINGLRPGADTCNVQTSGPKEWLLQSYSAADHGQAQPRSWSGAAQAGVRPAPAASASAGQDHLHYDADRSQVQFKIIEIEEEEPGWALPRSTRGGCFSSATKFNATVAESDVWGLFTCCYDKYQQAKSWVAGHFTRTVEALKEPLRTTFVRDGAAPAANLECDEGFVVKLEGRCRVLEP